MKWKLGGGRGEEIFAHGSGVRSIIVFLYVQGADVHVFYPHQFFCMCGLLTSPTYEHNDILNLELVGVSAKISAMHLYGKA